MTNIVLISVTLILAVNLVAGCDLIVTTTDGDVQGSSFTSPDGSTFYSWRGIPYAKPPLGELRFQPPQRPEPWDTVLDATKSGPACTYAYQYPNDPTPSAGNSEDCLTISVFTPALAVENLTQNLPVLFWIYGGGFSSGNSDFNFYDPTPFLLEDVIVVSFNYRLTLFGFLTTEDDVIPGNAGLKDQLLALQWTRDNIASFGGDPTKITIFGESAGAISVGYHLVSRKSRDLMAGAIMQSGSSICFFEVTDPRTTAYALAKSINPNITDDSDVADVMQSLIEAPVDVLINASSLYSFGPVLEPESDDAFMYEPHYELLAAGDNALIPVIVGHTSEEGIEFFYDEEGVAQTADLFDSDLVQLISPSMNLNDDANLTEIGNLIKEKYVGKDGKFADDLAAVVDWKSDNMFLRSSYKDVVLQSKYVSVYLYQFSFYGTRSKSRYIIPGAGLVGHSEELAYFFNVSTFPLETGADFLARSRAVKLWTNFAKTNNPTPEEDPLLQNITWETVQPDNVQYLDIGDDLVMKPGRKVEMAAFWDELWAEYTNPPYNTF